MMRPYYELPSLRGLLLEESYVLDIVAHPGEVSFMLDLVLTPDHPEHGPPKPGDQFCFRRAVLTFNGVGRLLWSNSGSPPARDASGEEDFGHVDSHEWDDAGHVLEGDWGRMEIVCLNVEVRLT